MFKWKSSDRPSTPKLSSVELPLSPQLRTHVPFDYEYPQKPTKSSTSFFNRFRSSDRSRSNARPSSDAVHSRQRSQSMSRKPDDDEVIYKPPRTITRSSSIMAKTTVTLVPSKASLEIEQEKREARQRLEELERASQAQAKPEPRPLKSCLKGASPPKSRLPTPSSQDFASSYKDGSYLKRHESAAAAYYSDTEQYRSHHQKPSARRSHTYPMQQQPMPPYPSDPRYHQLQPEHLRRARNHSFSTTPPINKANYVKACFKEVPMKDESIALSWPLVDFEMRNHKPYPALFFDAAFDPRLVGYEVKVMRYGETRLSPMSRDEETQLVSPHAFMTDMIIINQTLAQWPIYVRNPHGIRCIDVFRAIYDTYAIPLSQSEIVAWGPEYIDRCQRAFDQRCEDGPQLPPVTKMKGICRVDLLRGERIFKGLTPYTGPKIPGISPTCCWTLHFERMTKPRSNR